MVNAKCPDCGQTMIGSISCTKPYIRLNGEVYKRNTSYYDVNKECHDCGIKNHGGHVHHFGCDIERCPRCKGQLISCNCKKGAVLSTNGSKVNAVKTKLRKNKVRKIAPKRPSMNTYQKQLQNMLSKW